MHPLLTRRSLVKLIGLESAAILVAGCGQTAAPTAAPPAAAAPPTAPAPLTAAPAAAAPASTQAPTKAPAPTTAATKAPVSRDKTLVLGFEGGVVQAPETANPYVPGAVSNQGYNQCMVESWFYVNYETGKIVPWLAEGYEYNKDYTQVDIKLRKGIEWSDGKPFTAEDVIFTFDTFKANKGLTYGTEVATNVKEAKVVDSLTARLTFNEPYPRFLLNSFMAQTSSSASILPKHVWQGQDPMTFKNFDLEKGWPVYTGPYKLVKATSTEFVYDRRPDWWGAKTGFAKLPAPERIAFIEQGTQEKRAAMLESNEIDGCAQINLDLFLNVKQKNPLALSWHDAAPFGWVDPAPRLLIINNEVPPWDDKDMRWALSYGIDKQKMADAWTFNYGVPARYNNAIYPALEVFFEENKDLFDKYPVLTYDPKKAATIIEGKGYKKGADGIYAKDGKRLSTELLVATSAATEAATALMVNFLKGIGVDAPIKSLADAQVSALRNQADYVMSISNITGGVVDPETEFWRFNSRWIKPKGEVRSNNIPGFKNAEFDQLADKIRLLPLGDPAIKPLFRQALEIRLRELPVVALAQQIRVVPYTGKYWTNWPTAKNNYWMPSNWGMRAYHVILNIKPVTA